MIRKTFRFFSRRVLDVKSALGVNELRRSYGILSGLVQSVFSRIQPQRTESFEAAQSRLGLTDEALAERYAQLKRLYCIFLSVFGALFLYTAYLLKSGFFRAAFLSLLLCLIAGLFAFKQHFWMFQMRQQQLGCTLRQWFDGLRGGSS